MKYERCRLAVLHKRRDQLDKELVAIDAEIQEISIQQAREEDEVTMETMYGLKYREDEELQYPPVTGPLGLITLLKNQANYQQKSIFERHSSYTSILDKIDSILCLLKGGDGDIFPNPFLHDEDIAEKLPPQDAAALVECSGTLIRALEEDFAQFKDLLNVRLLAVEQALLGKVND